MAARKREPDPPAQLAELRAALRGEGLQRGYLLRGEERYFRERAIDLLKERALELGLEFSPHDAQDPDFALPRLIDDLVGAALFAAGRLVVVRGPEKLLQKSEGEESPLSRALLAFLEREGDPGGVVLSVAALRADHAVARAVARGGGRTLGCRKLWDTPPPWGSRDPRRAELCLWLVARAREMGVRLTPDQAVYLAAATGNELFALEDQLEKLRDAPERDLRELVSWDAAAAPWSVADALVEGDLPRSLAGVETLFHGGFAERDGRRQIDSTALAAILIGSLASSVRRGLAIRRGLERGLEGGSAAREAGLSGAPSTVKAAIERASGRPAREWRSMLEDVADLERRAKSGAGVDVADFAHLALLWSRPGRRASPTGSGR